MIDDFEDRGPLDPGVEPKFPWTGETDQEYSDRMHRENDPHYIGDDEIIEADGDGDDDSSEWLIECDYCDGDGWNNCDGIKVECAACGGTGWI